MFNINLTGSNKAEVIESLTTQLGDTLVEQSFLGGIVEPTKEAVQTYLNLVNNDNEASRGINLQVSGSLSFDVDGETISGASIMIQVDLDPKPFTE